MRVLFALVLLLAVHSATAEEVHTVPTDIQHYFKRNSCWEVMDYYSESRVIEKPYLYGIRSAVTGNKVKKDYSFIAWCKSTGGDGQYVLVGQLDGIRWPGGCKFPIRDFDYPGGLSVSRRTVDLSEFTNFPHKSAGRRTSFGPVIRSERDGLAYEVFCHRGMWVKRNID